MPHFVIDCSKNILKIKSPEIIMKKVFDIAKSTNLFHAHEIKVRINSYQHYIIGNSQDNFIHVFTNIMEGRTISQKKELSNKIVNGLNLMFPDVPIISMNIQNFEKATYFNKEMI